MKEYRRDSRTELCKKRKEEDMEEEKAYVDTSLIGAFMFLASDEGTNTFERRHFVFIAPTPPFFCVDQD